MLEILRTLNAEEGRAQESGAQLVQRFNQPQKSTVKGVPSWFLVDFKGRLLSASPVALFRSPSLRPS